MRGNHPITLSNNTKKLVGIGIVEDPNSFEFSDPEVEGPFPTTAVAREGADVYIQRKIQRHERIIRYYNRHHNALTITCRIPPEILGSILSEVARTTTYYRRYFNGAWMRAVSHTCSHWRQVALATPNLWSDIKMDRVSWAMEMVRRSKSVPLAIEYQGTFAKDIPRTYSTLTEILRYHLPRTRSLTIDTKSRFDSDAGSDASVNLFKELLPVLCQPAPIIEDLKLRFHRFPYTAQYCKEVVLIAPRLQHLTLEGYGMMWSSESIDLGNLRSLELSHLVKEVRPSTTQLLAILRQMPWLKDLKIIYDKESFIRDSPSLPQSLDPVHLHHLEDIYLSDGLSSCALLLRHIIFSKNSRTIRLCMYAYPSDPDTLTSSAQIVAEKINDWFEGSIVKLEIYFTIQCWVSKDITQIPDRDVPSTMDVEFSVVDDYSSVVEAMKPFLRSLRLYDLLSLKVSKPVGSDVWSIIGDLPHLKDLFVVQGNEDSLLKVLRRGLVQASDAPFICPSFPSLCSLKITGWDLDDNFITVEPDPESQVMQLLISCFELRKKAELPLDFLQVVSCRGVDGDEIDHLREIIKKVDWDGIGRKDSEEDEEYYNHCGYLYY